MSTTRLPSPTTEARSSEVTLADVVKRRRRARAADDAARGPGALEGVRGILLPDVKDRLERLEGRRELSPDAVGDMFADALAWSANKRERELARALESPVARALGTIANEQPEALANVLAPSITSAVLKAVRAAITKLTARFDETLARSASLEALRWRLEAFQTGVPLGEVVLRRALVYKVEEVFLVHAETSIVLEHVAAPGVSPRGPDQAAALLSAISSFADEAFAAGHAARPEDGLEDVVERGPLVRFMVGDVMVWADRGPQSIVAAVVRGAATPDLGDALARAHDRIRSSLGAEIAAFRSDVSPFVLAKEDLARCLLVSARRPRRRARVVFALIAVALVGLAIFTTYAWFTARRLARDAASALGDVEGLVVTQLAVVNGRAVVTGLRDPLAASPAELLAAHGVPDSELHFSPFVSTAPSIVLARARLALEPDATVSLAMEGDTLVARGRASRTWLARARESAALVPGVSRLDASAVSTPPWVDELASAAATLAAVRVEFARGESTFEAGASTSLDAAADAYRDAARAALALGDDVCLRVTGHADARGGPAINDALKRARALRIASALVARGVPEGGVATSIHDGPSERAVSLTLARRAGAGSSTTCGGGPP